MSLGTLGSAYLQLKRRSEASKAFREGAALVRPFAEKLPRSRFEKLLISLESDLEETEGKQGIGKKSKKRF